MWSVTQVMAVIVALWSFEVEHPQTYIITKYHTQTVVLVNAESKEKNMLGGGDDPGHSSSCWELLAVTAKLSDVNQRCRRTQDPELPQRAWSLPADGSQPSFQWGACSVILVQGQSVHTPHISSWNGQRNGQGNVPTTIALLHEISQTRYVTKLSFLFARRWR